MNTTNTELLSHGGKQIRPMISLLMARACSGGTLTDDTIKFAVASELLHNATLLHDDVADKSDERRSRPTLRKLMGPDVSVLVGDFWLVRAVKAVLDSESGTMGIIRLFSQTLSDLAEGEMLQLQKASSCDTDFDDYLAIIYRKTASLFVAACASAAISVGADDRTLKAASDFGKYVGYAFQMRDDIFDYMPLASVGKPVGVDVMEKKITLPLLGAFANCSVQDERRLRGIVRNISEQNRDEIIQFVRSSGGLEYSQEVLTDNIRKAIDAINVLKPSHEKEILCNLAEYIAIRNV